MDRRSGATSCRVLARDARATDRIGSDRRPGQDGRAPLRLCSRSAALVPIPLPRSHVLTDRSATFRGALGPDPRRAVAQLECINACILCNATWLGVACAPALAPVRKCRDGANLCRDGAASVDPTRDIESPRAARTAPGSRAGQVGRGRDRRRGRGRDRGEVEVGDRSAASA